MNTYHLDFKNTMQTAKCTKCACRKLVGTSDGDLVCTACGIVLKTRMQAEERNHDGQESFDDMFTSATTVSSLVVNSGKNYRDNEGEYSTALNNSNCRAKKLVYLNRNMHGNDRLEEMRDHVASITYTINASNLLNTANHIITLWQEKKGEKDSDTYRARVTAAWAAVILASRIKNNCFSLRLIALETKMNDFSITKIGKYVREMDRYLKKEYKMLIPTARGVYVALRWASVLHKYGCNFFGEEVGAMSFLRGIIRQFNFDEGEIASGPDTISAVLIWLCSTILRYGNPLHAKELSIICSPITIRLAVNRLLKRVDFLERIIDLELPPDYHAITTSLFSSSVDLRLRVVSSGGKKKSKNCKRKRE